MKAGDTDMMRFKCRARSDGKEGFVSPTGSASTVFLKESKMHYIIKKDVGLRKVANYDNSDFHRTLEADEVIEVVSGPSEAKNEPVQRTKCRALADNVEGWMTLKA